MRNETLNPGTQLMHPTPFAKVSEVILAPVNLNATEAFADLFSKLAVISFLMHRRWGKYGWLGRNLPSNVRGLRVVQKLILSELRGLSHLEGSLKGIRASLSWILGLVEYICDAGEGGLGYHEVDGGESMKEPLLMKKLLHLRPSRDLRLRVATSSYNIFHIVNRWLPMGASLGN